MSLDVLPGTALFFGVSGATYHNPITIALPTCDSACAITPRRVSGLPRHAACCADQANSYKAATGSRANSSILGQRSRSSFAMSRVVQLPSRIQTTFGGNPLRTLRR